MFSRHFFIKISDENDDVYSSIDKSDHVQALINSGNHTRYIGNSASNEQKPEKVLNDPGFFLGDAIHIAIVYHHESRVKEINEQAFSEHL
ncbi:hypothetical protein JCM12856_13540 [Spirochaeta dissipatitropha]